MGYIDTWGRGIDKIVNGLKAAGQEEPVFEETKYSFCLTMKPLFVTDATENATGKSQKDHSKITEDSQKDYNNLTELMINILSMVKEKPFITTTEIANELNVKRETISRNISKLKNLVI